MRHKLTDILTIAVLAVICGAGGFVEIVTYAQHKRDWLKTFLDLPHGLPNHDTFSRVFARLDPDAFEAAFRQWTGQLAARSGGKLVAVDGKSLRRSFENAWDKAGMAHLVSAFVADNRLVLGQLQADGPGRELDAVTRLLKSLDLQGAVVTTDALSCQVHIAELITQGRGDYLLKVKGNQPTLEAQLQTVVEEAVLEKLAAGRPTRIRRPTAGTGGSRPASSPCSGTPKPWARAPSSGPSCGVWYAWRRPARCRGRKASRPATSGITTSAVSTAGTPRSRSWATAAGTGAWRTTCTGLWT